MSFTAASDSNQLSLYKLFKIMDDQQKNDVHARQGDLLHLQEEQFKNYHSLELKILEMKNQFETRITKMETIIATLATKQEVAEFHRKQTVTIITVMSTVIAAAVAILKLGF